MEGFGVRCPYCRAKVVTRGHWKTSESQRVAIVRCFRCKVRCRVSVTISPVRQYRKKTVGGADTSNVRGRASRRRGVLISPERASLDPDTYGLGERCPKCGAGMYIRSSRYIGKNHKAFYLDCPEAGCSTRQRADLRGSILPSFLFSFWPATPVPIRRLLVRV
ncbi:ogr/Delta-like zinc finger family protein [Salinicola sp. V024]|uniref:ogr/Delta-like zinc finger family protein n=1 Tax=Salinicola sp. V024 TaxID=3459609 RepID=UPI004044CF99